jgi:hypothetical protein
MSQHMPVLAPRPARQPHAPGCRCDLCEHTRRIVTAVLDRVDYIRDIADDDEAAHRAEDRLYREVLDWIATGQIDLDAAPDVAAFALESGNIRFGRWCA